MYSIAVQYSCTVSRKITLKKRKGGARVSNKNAAIDGCKGGRPRGGGSTGQAKIWLLNKMKVTIEQYGVEAFYDLLKKLLVADVGEYLRIMVSLMPRDHQIDLTITRFSTWTDAQLQKFVATGEYPEECGE